MSSKEQKEQLAIDIKETIQAIFPSSYVNARYSTNLSESICVTFALGANKKEWAHGIIENDLAHSRVWVWFKPERIVIECNNGFGITIKPTDKFYYCSHHKVGFRKTTIKDNDYTKVIAPFKRNFLKMKVAIQENHDKLLDSDVERVIGKV
jgi:hypothetical protein